MQLSRPVAGLSAVAMIAAGLAFVPPAQAVDTTSQVVITEVYGGGGNSGAPYNKDFVELVNHGSTPVDLTGWSVQYGSASGTSWQVTALTGTIDSGAYYLISESGGSTGAALPAPDVAGTIAMAAGSGKIALVDDGTMALTCGSACSGAAGVVDYVGYGSANDAAGTATPVLSNTTSAQRRTDPFTNTGNNSSDFVVASPTPDAGTAAVPGGTDCSATPTPAECVPGPDTIQDVQGDGFLSPLAGTTVSKVPGVVTAVRTAYGASPGFWIQEPSPSLTRTSASSAVFVYAKSPSVSVGDSVLVSGKVSEYYTLGSGETLADTASLSQTEISPTAVTTVNKGNALPQPLLLTPTTVPERYAPSPSSGNVETISPLDPSDSALEFWEAHEGMRVEVDDARVVGPGKPQYGEIYVTTKPDQQATPRGGTYLPGYDATPSGRVLVKPVTNSVPAANVGDELTGATIGPVDWSTYGGYDIAATQLGTYQDNGLTPTVATPQAADQLAIATYNVENLSPTDPASKFAGLASGVVHNLASPDIISVEEIQDNDGATDDGVVAADQTLTELTQAIVAAGGPAYQWAEIDPVNDHDGGQPGGNIRVVFLYNPDRVTFDAIPGGDATTAVAVSRAADGTAQLSASPGLVDPTNAAWTSSRKPLVGEFTFDGRKVFVVGNHFAAKLGDQNADGRFQPPTRRSEVQRKAQATVLNAFVHQVLAADPTADVVLAGDFNDYQFSPSITTLTDDGATLTDLINTLPADERYTYVYNGISQVLDHIFVSPALASAGVEYQVVHVNSEFAAQSSDHDPQVVRIRPTARPTTSGTIQLSPPTVQAGKDVLVHLRGFDPGAVLTVQLDGATVATVTAGKHGAVHPFTVPADVAPGAHEVAVLTADGAFASAALQVISPSQA